MVRIEASELTTGSPITLSTNDTVGGTVVSSARRRLSLRSGFESRSYLGTENDEHEHPNIVQATNVIIFEAAAANKK